MKTRQSIFNKIVKHLLKQNATSRTAWEDKSICAYRGEDGKKCAIGCLIPNKLYRKCMETSSVEAISENFPELKEYLGIKSMSDIFFLGELQNLHDHVPSSQWRCKLESVARENALQFPKT